MLVVLGGVLIEIVDRLIILNLLGVTSLGYYGITSFGGVSAYRLLAQAGQSYLLRYSFFHGWRAYQNGKWLSIVDAKPRMIVWRVGDLCSIQLLKFWER